MEKGTSEDSEWYKIDPGWSGESLGLIYNQLRVTQVLSPLFCKPVTGQELFLLFLTANRLCVIFLCTVWKRQNISHLTNIRESFSSPRFTICAISSLFPDKHLKNFQRCLYGHFKLSHWYQSHYRSHKSHQVILYPPGIFTLMVLNLFSRLFFLQINQKNKFNLFELTFTLWNQSIQSIQIMHLRSNWF